MSTDGRRDDSRPDARLRPFRRLIKRRDFLAAASGRRFHSERMTVQGRLRDEETGGMRVGFTLTKRVGNAVERNRIKRRLRAAVRQLGGGAPDAEALGPEGAGQDIAPNAAPTSDMTVSLPGGADAASRTDWPALAADIVVIGRRSAIDAQFDALVADLARALPKVTKPGDPAKRSRGQGARSPSSHRRRGRGGMAARTGPAPSQHS
ncbi:ribonuclease P protein component [Saliniramus sp.]|uniref:ribonuclease P protein component n=1 Tax=Saliniramus sp. TaxID=2986772 RepID=UPI002BF43FF6|nr:ribonuclease P protein component [Saliniramus sp.]HMB10699.1 ribonuclease P protein component [Saliniramus sp.]